MPIIKTTKYMCTKCFKTLEYKDLNQVQTITINFNETRYSHYCPICRNNEFRLKSIIIKS